MHLLLDVPFVRMCTVLMVQNYETDQLCPHHYFLWQYAAVTTAFSLCPQEKPLLVNIWIIANSVFFMAYAAVTVLCVFMVFEEWKLALLPMKSSILCAGKIKWSTSVTWTLRTWPHSVCFSLMSLCPCCVLFV